MATQVQLRRGTATENDAFTGAQGELTYDTTNKRVRIHDGGTAGGFELKTENSSGDTLFADGEKAIFGAGSDLQIYHNGSNSYIDDTGTGGLILRGSSDIYLGNLSGETYIRAIENGSVQLRYDNATKLATTSTGIDVTGVITTDGLTTSADINFGDNDKAIFGAGSDLQIYHNGSHSFIQDTGTGNLRLLGTDVQILNSANNEFMAVFNDNAGVSLYYDNAVKLATTSTGIDVTGTVTADGLTVDGTSGTYPTATIQHSDYATEGEFLRIARSDSPSIRYHSIFAKHGADAANSYIGFNVHSYSTNTSQITALKINGNGDISFYEDTGTTAKFFWDASAKSLGIGTGSPNVDLHVAGSGNIRIDGNNPALRFTNGDSEEMYIQCLQVANGGRALRVIDSAAGSERMRIDSSGNLLVGCDSNKTTGITVDGGVAPFVDNARDLGTASFRWDDIYATNATIQTSDEREKQDIDVLSDAEHNVAVAAKGLIRKYRWKDAVAEKGDDARIHFGVIAQDLKAAFEAEGLDAGRYAMFIHSEWWETYTDVPAVEAKDAVLDDDGNVIEEAVEAKEAYTRTDTYDTEAEAPEGAVKKDRMGVRYPELLAFIIGAM